MGSVTGLENTVEAAAGGRLDAVLLLCLTGTSATTLPFLLSLILRGVSIGLHASVLECCIPLLLAGLSCIYLAS